LFNFKLAAVITCGYVYII